MHLGDQNFLWWNFYISSEIIPKKCVVQISWNFHVFLLSSKLMSKQNITKIKRVEFISVMVFGTPLRGAIGNSFQCKCIKILSSEEKSLNIISSYRKKKVFCSNWNNTFVFFATSVMGWLKNPKLKMCQ